VPRRLSFLPVFFTILGIAFAIALVMRMRAYSRLDEQSATTTTTSASTQATTSTRRVNNTPAETGTIVEATTATAPTTSTQLTQRNPRERRYNNLLQPQNNVATPVVTPSIIVARPNVTAPHAIPHAQAEKPSLIQKIVAPIVKAFGGGEQSKPPQASPQTQKNRGGDDEQKNREEDDPTSDTQPPRVLAVEFMPPTVHDGEETALIVTAVDQLSGIRSISGSIASPSGALQGFACQREGESDRYIARIAVPKDAAEGQWKVNYLTLTDNASNSINLSGAQGMLPPTAQFKVVSNRPDSTGPTLKAVWLDRMSMQAGQHNTLFVQAEDDKSGVTLVSGVFLSPTKHARIGFGCRMGGSATWECDIAPPQCLDCGSWQLEQVQLQDKANNMTTARNDNQLVNTVKLDIMGDSCDSGQPGVTGISLDQQVVSNVEASTITVTAAVNDDACGVASVSGQAVGPSGSGAQPRIYFSFSSSGEGGVWLGRIGIPKLAAKGIWSISWIQVLDKGHNLKTYSQSDPVLQGAQFRVQ